MGSQSRGRQLTWKWKSKCLEKKCLLTMRNPRGTEWTLISRPGWVFPITSSPYSLWTSPVIALLQEQTHEAAKGEVKGTSFWVFCWSTSINPHILKEWLSGYMNYISIKLLLRKRNYWKVWNGNIIFVFLTPYKKIYQSTF